MAPASDCGIGGNAAHRSRAGKTRPRRRYGLRLYPRAGRGVSARAQSSKRQTGEAGAVPSEDRGRSKLTPPRTPRNIRPRRRRRGRRPGQRRKAARSCNVWTHSRTSRASAASRRTGSSGRRTTGPPSPPPRRQARQRARAAAGHGRQAVLSGSTRHRPTGTRRDCECTAGDLTATVVSVAYGEIRLRLEAETQLKFPAPLPDPPPASAILCLERKPGPTP